MESESNNIYRKFPNVFKWVILLCIIYGLLVLSLLLMKFWPINFPENISTWGQIGDYIGGMLNPFFGLITVFLVIYNIHIQKIELSESNNALTISNKTNLKASFENSLFAWLGNYRDLIQQTSYDNMTGRSALNRLVIDKLSTQRVIEELHGKNSSPAQHLRWSLQNSFNQKDVSDSSLDDLSRLFIKAFNSYEEAYKNNRSELDSPLRTIYRIYKWIDDSKYIKSEDKWTYTALVRAQLSWPELCILFYNCQTKNGKNFAEFANKYAIFDNLDEGGDLIISYRKRQIIENNVNESPLAKSAFSSKEAKNALGVPEDI